MVPVQRNIGYRSKCTSPDLDRRTPSCAQTTSELYVFLLYGDALGVDSAKVCVVEEVHEEGFCGFLEGYNGLTLPPIGAVLGCDCLCDLADEALKGEF